VKEYSNEELTQKAMIKKEISRMRGPVDLSDLTERCDELEGFRKLITVQLEANITANSGKFVDGLSTIKEVEGDLVTIKAVVQGSKTSISTLQAQHATLAVRVLGLERKKLRL